MSSIRNAPPSMIYNQRQVPAVDAKMTVRRFDATVGTVFSGAGQNEARIPVSGMDAFLDTNKGYLQFKVTSTAAASAVDFTAGSFIERIEIQNKGRVVWRGDRYSLYHNAKKAYNSDLGKINKLSANEGSRGLVTQQTAAAHAQHSVSECTMAGHGVEIADGEAAVFNLELECGMLKNDLKKAIPQGASFDLVIRFRANNAAIIAHTGSPVYNIENVRYYCPSYQILNSELMNMYASMVAQGAVAWSGDYLKTYVNSTNAGAGPSSLQINDRSLSVKGFLTILRASGADATLANCSNSAFQVINATGTVTSYEMNMAGAILPASGRIEIQTATNGRDCGRAYTEALRVLCDAGETESTPTVTLTQFASSDAVVDSNRSDMTSIAKGVLSLDLRKFDDISLTMTGLNTAASSAPNTLQIDHTSFGAALDATTFSICQADWLLAPNGELNVAV